MAHRVTAPALQRAQRLLQQWVRPQVTTDGVPFSVMASPELFDSVTFERATSLPLSPFEIGASWGRPWHTVWFKLVATVPESLGRRPLVAVVDLGFSGRGDGFQVEGMAWRNGKRIQAVQPDRRVISLGVFAPGETIEVWIEAVATPIIAGHAFGYGPTPLGDPKTAGERPLYVLRRAELAAYNESTEELAGLLHSMIDLVIDLDEHSAQRSRLFDILERVSDVVDTRDLANTAPAAVALIRNQSTRLGPSSGHTVVVTGHAHLDTAWLWPIKETRRKAVRTFVNAIGLLRADPDAVFCHSQAQHYAWVREDAPEVFAEVVELVAAGRWEPVSGMWVETDLNLPDGESLIRQFLHGQHAFEEWFGHRCEGAFLPDDFGYPGTIPQIVRHCTGRWFFSQKMSWNESNSFPHHSFWWEGIDGSRIFTHFSPIDTYNALLTPSQLRFAERNFLDHVGSSMSLALYGHGDGGGGPTRQMVDRARNASLWGDVPSVEFGKVSDFFDRTIDEYRDSAPVWVGEMYLEKHRGTYSSQVETKRGNRRCEQLLHEWELWSVCAGSGGGIGEIDERSHVWKRVLTQQFHDIIPGSSISWVHRDAEDEHRSIADLIEQRLDSVIDTASTITSGTRFANPAPVVARGVEMFDGRSVWVDVPAFTVSATSIRTELPDDVMPVAVRQTASGGVEMSNGLVRVEIDELGSIIDLVDELRGRSLIPGDEVARIVTRRDTPAEYDAWDIDRADADAPWRYVQCSSSPRLTEHCELSATVECHFALAQSQCTLFLTLKAGEPIVHFRVQADWTENETRLQFVLPVDVLAREAVCGIQFGHVRRPRHANTSWDSAKFEICAHRYVYVSEPGCGIAILADGPHGYDVRNEALRLTLLRSPSFPDPTCDRGSRTVEWAVYVDDGPGHVGDLEQVCARLAHPIRQVSADAPVVESPVSVNIPGVLVSALKYAQDGSGDLILRLWETRGSKSKGTVAVNRHVSTAYQMAQVHLSNGLEDDMGRLDVTETDSRGGVVPIEIGPFEIVTLRLSTDTV